MNKLLLLAVLIFNGKIIFDCILNLFYVRGIECRFVSMYIVSHIRVTTTHSRTRGTGETVRVSEARFTNHGHWFLVNFFLCGQEELCVFKRIFVLLREPLLLLSGPLTMLLSDLFCC